MLEVFISLIGLVVGAVIGYLFHKSRAHQIIVEKELLAQENEQLKTRETDFARLHEESLKSAKSVMFETSRELSKELLESHKRENIESRKQAEEITKKETENLHKEFKNIVEKVAALNSQHQNNDKKLSAIWQSLSSPVKASNFAEIGLENTLKSFGLEPGVDFVTQSTIDGTRLRPDAIIYLPSGNLMMIDAKTSKYFIEIAAEENDAGQLKEKLKASMNSHLKQLCTKDYAEASRGKDGALHVVNVMYLPNDTAHSRVLECDGEFNIKCRDAGVLLVTPTSLHMLLSIATHQISRVRQEQNHQLILESMGKVISSVDNLLRGLNELGSSIKRSAKIFSDLSGTVNSRVIPRIKTALKLGLKPEKEIKLPNSLPNFTITDNETVIVEMEAEPGLEAPDKLKVLEKKAS